MSIIQNVKVGDKVIEMKSVMTRKVRRQIMKNQLGTNKIRQAWKEAKA